MEMRGKSVHIHGRINYLGKVCLSHSIARLKCSVTLLDDGDKVEWRCTTAHHLHTFFPSLTVPSLSFLLIVNTRQNGSSQYTDHHLSLHPGTRLHAAPAVSEPAGCRDCRCGQGAKGMEEGWVGRANRDC